ncbi:MAG TPA: Hsp20/alpha crystallin family protein [Mycobacteriales bacterium]|jgi:HSP20 family protein|nr:Hsp20/alpha crystallin family protein [Mycobacteriales bacterium]
MAVTRWDPFTALARFDREFDELVRRGWGGAGAARSGFVPPVELLTRGSDVVIRLELPGVDVERDVEVEVDKGRLVVKGERRDEQGEQAGGYLVRELRYGSFRREFALPEGVSAENVEAHYDQGMLEVVVHEAVRREPEPQQVKIGMGRGRQAIESTATEGSEQTG